MSNISIDVYAHTNPAFWALALHKFVAGYIEARGNNQDSFCEYPALFLPLPLVFSKEARLRFKGTKKTTGLMSWLERNPSVRAIVGSELISAKPYSRRALTFALAHQVLSTSDGWSYTASNVPKLKNNPWPPTKDERGEIMQVSQRLGQWCGIVDLATVFIALGVRP